MKRLSAFSLVANSAVLLSLPLAGCGGPAPAQSADAYPVKGQVLLASGKPLNGGRVVFLPRGGSGMTAIGAIGPDGNFALKTADDREGAPAGDYKIRVEADPSAATKRGGRAVLPFSAQYADEDGETGLTATVKAEPTTLQPFRLVAVAAASKRDRD